VPDVYCLHRKTRLPMTTARKLAIALMLLAPYVGLCFPAVYNRATPALFGFPFFYWYQFAWVILTSALLLVIHRMLKRPAQ